MVPTLGCLGVNVAHCRTVCDSIVMLVVHTHETTNMHKAKFSPIIGNAIEWLGRLRTRVALGVAW